MTEYKNSSKFNKQYCLFRIYAQACKIFKQLISFITVSCLLHGSQIDYNYITDLLTVIMNKMEDGSQTFDQILPPPASDTDDRMFQKEMTEQHGKLSTIICAAILQFHAGSVRHSVKLHYCNGQTASNTRGILS